MSYQTPQTLAGYKKAFRAASIFICLLPIGGSLDHSRFAFIYPPLGNGPLTGLALIISTLLAGTAGILPWK